MRKAILFLLLFVFFVGFAWSQSTQAPEPTVAELKLQLAQKDVENAQLNLQLLQAQAQLIQMLYQQAQQKLTIANKAVQDITPKSKVMKPTTK